MTLKAVVLPAPFGPIRPRISPWSMWKLTPSSAVTPPNLSVMSSISSNRIGAALGGTSTGSATILPLLLGIAPDLAVLGRDPAHEGLVGGLERLLGLPHLLSPDRAPWWQQT